MEKFSFVRDGAMKLPPGFRFQPTDEELVFQYLKCKVFSLPLPTTIIPDLNVCKFDPWDLPGELEQERYFFSSKEAKYGNGKRINRATSSGYWKVTGSDKQIVSPRSHEMVGMRKTLVFHKGKPPYSCRTDWIMHEYRLAPKPAQPQVQDQPIQSCLNNMEKWVLCRIFLKKRSMRSDEEENGGTCGSEKTVMGQARFFQFRTSEEYNSENDESSSSSSSSSAITKASSAGFDHEESSSCNIIF